MERKKWKNEKEGIRSQPKTEKEINKTEKQEIFALLGCYAAHIGGQSRLGITYRSHLQGSSSVREILGMLDP